MRGATICLLAVIGISSEARAACRERTLEVFPSSGAALPTNGQLVLTVPRHLKRLGGRAPWQTLTLSAETERVALKVVETLRGADGEMQMVLVPAAPLRPETTYELAIADVPVPWDKIGLEQQLPGSLPGRPSEIVRFAWTTAPTSDRAGPRWRAAPKAGSGVNQQLGCGSDLFVPVSVSIGSDEVVQYLADVTPLSGGQDGGEGKTRRYLLEPSEGEIEIGRQMCGGPFRLMSGVHYSVKLTAIDIAGNRSPAPGPPLEIVGPRRSR